jgi:hypothetical protein
MTTIVVTCDRCGNVTELGRVKLSVVAGELKAGRVEQATGGGAWTCARRAAASSMGG